MMIEYLALMSLYRKRSRKVTVTLSGGKIKLHAVLTKKLTF